MTPEEVMAIQRQLVAAGLLPPNNERGLSNIDGNYGPATQRAHQLYQQQQIKQQEASRVAQEQQRVLEQQRAQNEAAKIALEQKRAEQQQIDAERRRGREDFENSAIGQVYDAGKLIAPLGLGVWGGTKMAKGVEARQAAMAPSELSKMGRMGRFAPYLVQSGAYFLPEGLALRYLASDMDEGLKKDLTESIGTGLLAAGGGSLAKGGINSLTPPKEMTPRAEVTKSTPKRKYSTNTINDLDRDVAVLNNNNKQVDLYAEAKRLGLEPKKAMNKTQLSQLLLNSGKKLSAKMYRSLPWVAGGLAAGLTAADQASAADLEPLEQAGVGLGVGAGVGAGAYGLMKGGEKLAQKIGQYGLGRAALRAVPGGFGALAAYDTVNAWPLSTKQDMEAMAGITSQPMSPEEAGLADYLMKKQLQDQQIQSMTHGPNQIGHY